MGSVGLWHRFNRPVVFSAGPQCKMGRSNAAAFELCIAWRAKGCTEKSLLFIFYFFYTAVLLLAGGPTACRNMTRRPADARTLAFFLRSGLLLCLCCTRQHLVWTFFFCLFFSPSFASPLCHLFWCRLLATLDAIIRAATQCRSLC